MKNLSFDGLRGVAILFVIFCHYFAHSAYSGTGIPLRWHQIDFQSAILNFGSVGVTLFFILSAYLLSQNFLIGKYNSLKQYAQKRFFRIYPAFIVSTIIYLCLYMIFGKYKFAAELNIKFILVCVTFLQPIFIWTKINAIDISPGTWSLYPEVYFYLLLPLVMFLLIKLKKPMNILAGFIFLTLVFRSHNYAQPNWSISMSLIFYLDAFSAGIILSILAEKAKARKFEISEYFGWGLIFISLTNLLPIVDSTTTRTIGGVVVIKAIIDGHESIILRNRIIQRIGQRSYGLFLVHIYVFWYASVPLLDKLHIHKYSLRLLAGGIFGFILSFMLAEMSYRFLENSKYYQGKRK